MVRTFVIGDIHGAHRALLQCLERASFNYETDSLISLGDVADGWPETRQCIDELLKIRNLTYVFGNHDFWTLEWMETRIVEPVWFEQGGKATMKSYAEEIPETHIRFLKQALSYYLLGKKLFVHAGINPRIPLEGQSLQTLLWDRSLAHTAYDHYIKGISRQLTPYDEVYIGHTPIIPYLKPIQSGDIWFMDTGAGWSGVLSIMDIQSKEIFTSDAVPSLYPGIEGRRRK
jgi:serine/threonine protein phosphatase 1